jgi:hypothetical protein
MYNERDDDESWYKVLSEASSFSPSGDDVSGSFGMPATGMKVN